jgi:hypothetical protein
MNTQEDSIIMGLNEIGCEGWDWINLTRDGFQWMAFVNTVMNLGIP